LLYERTLHRTDEVSDLAEALPLKDTCRRDNLVDDQDLGPRVGGDRDASRTYIPLEYA